MIGLDTNVLVRYLTQDDAVQSPKATHLIEEQLSRGAPGFISIVVAAETAWVLRRSYGWSEPEVGSILDHLLKADTLVVEHEAEVSEAAIKASRGAAPFADTLIAALASKAGCTHTVTFDSKASRLPGFSAV